MHRVVSSQLKSRCTVASSPRLLARQVLFEMLFATRQLSSAVRI